MNIEEDTYIILNQKGLTLVTDASDETAFDLNSNQPLGKHEYCPSDNGFFYLQSYSNTHNSVRCSGCGAEEQIPYSIMTIRSLIRHCEKLESHPSQDEIRFRTEGSRETRTLNLPWWFTVSDR